MDKSVLVANSDYESFLDNIETIVDAEEKEQLRELLENNTSIKITTHIAKEKKATIKSPFVVTFPENLMTLASLGITPRELKVTAYLLTAMEFGNLLFFSQKQACADLLIDKASMSRIFKSLHAKGVLVEHNGHTYVNSNLFLKGLKQGMTKERSQHLKNAQSSSTGFKDTH